MSHLKQLVTTGLALGLVLGAVPVAPFSAVQASSPEAWKELYAKAHVPASKPQP